MSTPAFQKVTPFIRRLNLNGGTLYAFTSAGEDLTLTLNDSSTRKFRFSKFALLDIPEILNRQFSNTLKLNAIPGAWNSVNFTRTTDWSVHLSESFQNYCLNLETMITSSDSYDPNEDATVSERVFFKWLKEMGGVRFQEQAIEGVNSSRYTEEGDSDIYNRVVKYIGNIDVVNNLSGQINSYTEVYINIPTELGNTPDVLFKSVSDNNYSPGMTFCRINDGLDNEVISGRHYTDIHPDNLDIHAFYDNDSGLFANGSGAGLTLYKKYAGRTDSEDDITLDYAQNSWWFLTNSNTNCYHLEPAEFTNPDDTDLAIKENDTVLKFRRTNLDGIQIDWDINTYNKYNPYLSAKTLSDLAMSSDSTDFEFNAVLIYYDVYTRVEDELTGAISETIFATNLYGVLFLDNVEATSQGGGKIPVYKKCRPNEIINLNGNAYSLKLNIKLNTDNIDSGVHVESFVSDSNTFSMDIFSDVLRELLDISETNIFTNLNMLAIDQRLKTLEDTTTVPNVKRINELLALMLEIKDTLNSSRIVDFINESANVNSLIERNYNILYELLGNRTNINVTYDLGNLKEGPGISIRKIGEQIVLGRSYEDYNYSDRVYVRFLELEKEYIANQPFLSTAVELQTGGNYLRFEEEAAAKVVSYDNIILKIDDLKNQWRRGQVFRLNFATPYDFQRGKDFYIFTDKANLKKTNNITYGVRLKIPGKLFNERRSSSFGYKIEIQCIDDVKMEFIYDIIQ